MAKDFDKKDWPDTRYRQLPKRPSPAFPTSGEKKSNVPVLSPKGSKDEKKVAK